MKQERAPRTVILLVDGNASVNNDFMKEWLEKSPFMTNETANIFQALEEITDFTTAARPDVVLVEVDSLKNDFDHIRSLMHTFSCADNFPILALSDSGKIINDKECFEGNLAEVQAHIAKVLPRNAKAAPAAN